MDDTARINKRLVNERLSNTANAALEASETYAGKIVAMASEIDELLVCLSDGTQMNLAERMFRAMSARQKIAWIVSYAHTIRGEIAPVWDSRRQIKGAKES